MTDETLLESRSTVGGHPRWVRLILIAFTVIALDQTTKFLAVGHLTYAFEHARAKELPDQLRAFVHARHLTFETKPHVDVVPWFWSNRYAENDGAAFSLLASLPEKIRIPFFDVVSFLAIILIVVYYSRLRGEQALLSVALALVLGGAVGNLIDRMVRGYVIDFVDWHLHDPEWHTPTVHWPTFNIADTGISMGVMLIFLDTLIAWWHARRAPAPPAPAAADV